MGTPYAMAPEVMLESEEGCALRCPELVLVVWAGHWRPSCCMAVVARCVPS